MEALRWENNCLRLLDQSALPLEERYFLCREAEEVAEAIRGMRVRGAPAIGAAAAFGLALAASNYRGPEEGFWQRLEGAKRLLASTRPTAVNLFWALGRMRARAEALRASGREAVTGGLLEEAQAIFREDREANLRLSEHGQALLSQGARVLTHCNAGALATCGFGTALGVIRASQAHGKEVRVLADETRPLLQGARLTAWELQKEGIPVTLITDGMAAYLMSRGEVDAVLVGADRIAANGDVANKIGTYGLAILAKHHGLPFYVAAPSSTIDLSLESGREIIIEEREQGEVLTMLGQRIAPEGVAALNPAFDVTPYSLISAIITEAGIIYPPFREGLARAAGRGLAQGGKE